MSQFKYFLKAKIGQSSSIILAQHTSQKKWLKIKVNGNLVLYSRFKDNGPEIRVSSGQCRWKLSERFQFYQPYCIKLNKKIESTYPISEAIDECLDVDFGEWVSKSESDLYKNDSRLGKLEITNALLKFTEPPLEEGWTPSGVRPGDAPSFLKFKE